MSAPIALVPKPTADEEISANIVHYLTDLLADAHAGRLTSVVCLWERPDGKWGHAQSGSPDMSRTIGRLEIVKGEWIAAYCSGSRVPDDGAKG
jgi:hypothetical protein